MRADEYERYGRQMIVPEVGLPGQLALRRSSVLIVGAGGLGCPAIAYLAGAGVGTLGIVDGDIVEASNLHRQILHTQPGISKAYSASQYVERLNPNVKVDTYAYRLDPQNASQIVPKYDLVLDCTDAPAIRYLINDACVLYKKRLVSAAALKTEGQLAVYNAGPDSPCYRCMFPSPPPPDLVGTCGDAGIIGPVVGIMGVYQAVEAIRLIVSNEHNPNSLSIFSMFSFPQWRQMRIRGRRSECKVCGDDPDIKTLEDIDYVQFCGVCSTQSARFQRVKASEVDFSRYTVIDVRPEVQFGICSLPNSINIPIQRLRKTTALEECPELKGVDNVLVVCRYGNDSIEAANKLTEWGLAATDLAGGLNAFSDVDSSFLRY